MVKKKNMTDREKDTELSSIIQLNPKNFEVCVIVCSQKNAPTLKQFVEMRIEEFKPKDKSLVVILSGNTVESAMGGRFDYSVVSWFLLCPQTEAHERVCLEQLSKQYGMRTMAQFNNALNRQKTKQEIAIVDVRCRCAALCECGLRKQ